MKTGLQCLYAIVHDVLLLPKEWGIPAFYRLLRKGQWLMVAILSERSGKALPGGQFRRVKMAEMGVLTSPPCRGPGGLPASSDRRPDEVSAGITAFGPELDDVVGGSDDVRVVLDDDDGVAAVEEGAEGGEEFLDVVEVEAGGGLVEDEEDGLVGLAGASGGTDTG